MKFKIEVEAQNGKVKREYVIEASNGEELSTELVRIEIKWVLLKREYLILQAQRLK